MKRISVLLLTFIIALMIAGCSNKLPAPETPNACVPSVMYDGNLYLTTGKQIPVEVEEDAIVGRITSVIPLSQWPEEDGQANFGIVDAPFAIITDGFVVLWNNEWTLFEMIEVDK